MMTVEEGYDLNAIHLLMVTVVSPLHLRGNPKKPVASLAVNWMMMAMGEGYDLNPIHNSHGHCCVYYKNHRFSCSGFCEIKYHLEMHS